MHRYIHLKEMISEMFQKIFLPKFLFMIKFVSVKVFSSESHNFTYKVLHPRKVL